MMAGTEVVAPRVAFFAGRQEIFAQHGSSWRRLSPEDVAHRRTGYSRETGDAKLGISIVPAHNGLVRIGFDVFRLGLNMNDAVIARLQQRWRAQAASFSKSLRRHVDRRTHFSKSFAEFSVRPEDVESWKAELEVTLGNPDAFEPVASVHK
jgi:hypothetical protein